MCPYIPRTVAVALLGCSFVLREGWKEGGGGAGDPLTCPYCASAGVAHSQHTAVFGREGTEKVIKKLAYRSPTEFTMSNSETETMRRQLAREILAGKEDDP